MGEIKDLRTHFLFLYFDDDEVVLRLYPDCFSRKNVHSSVDQCLILVKDNKHGKLHSPIYSLYFLSLRLVGATTFIKLYGSTISPVL